MISSRCNAALLSGWLAATLIALGAPVLADDPVLMELDGRVVTRAAFESRFAAAVRLLAVRQGVDIDSQPAGAIAGLRRQFLDRYTSDLVLLAEARRRGLAIDSAQVDEALAALPTTLRDGADDATRLQLRDIMRDELLLELLREQMIGEIRVPAGDVITMHHDIKDTLATPEQVCVRHIQKETEDEAFALLTRLQSGASFEELAATSSDDRETASAGGDLGCFKRTAGRSRSAFEQAAFDATEGDITGPVQSQFGWHLLLVYEHRLPRAPTLNEAYAEIERELALQQLPGRVQALVDASDLQVHADRLAGGQANEE